MEQNSVKTAPQPPSAFMPRKWAWAPGLSAPGPAQCEVCQKRLRSFLGPMLIGSNNTSCLGSRDIFLFLCNSGLASRCARACYPRLFILSRATGAAWWTNFMIFAGKIVLVTGSTTGIGEACAQVFAEAGAGVMV